MQLTSLRSFAPCSTSALFSVMSRILNWVVALEVEYNVGDDISFKFEVRTRQERRQTAHKQF
jgi:hypothetical protein